MKTREKALLFGIVLFLSIGGAFADTITKGLIGKEDVYWQVTDGGAPETYTRLTSTGATITLTRINGSHVPWDNAYTRTIRPKAITGNNSGAITNYSFSGTTIAGTTGSFSSTLGVTGAATFSSTAAVTGLLSSATNITSPASTITAMTYTSASGTTFTNTGVFTHGGLYRAIGTAAPTTGAHLAGDIVWSSSAAVPTVIADTPIYWICTVAGTPGTWVARYPLFRATPATATAFGKVGMVAIDNSYIYVVPLTDNAWKRVAVASW